MKVTIYGTDYVGLVTGACLAELGNEVVCVDDDAGQIQKLEQGHLAVKEPGLQALVEQNLANGRLVFTTDYEIAVQHGLFQFIAVSSTQHQQDGADLRAVNEIVRKIGQLVQGYCLIIIKSTVPVGTADAIKQLLSDVFTARNIHLDIDLASNPHFLRAGSAINDFMNPDRIIVGAENNRALDFMRELYMPLIDAGKRFMVMDTRSSELTKYASSSLLATKISFMDEMRHLADKLGANIEQIRLAMSMDPRIGEGILRASHDDLHFPKDIQALQRTAQDIGHELKVLTAAEAVYATKSDPR